MGRLMGTAFGPSTAAATGWVPLADVYETDDAYVVEVDLPGVKSKDINIEAIGNEPRWVALDSLQHAFTTTPLP
jgi:HSP20 family protein